MEPIETKTRWINQICEHAPNCLPPSIPRSGLFAGWIAFFYLLFLSEVAAPLLTSYRLRNLSKYYPKKCQLFAVSTVVNTFCSLKRYFTVGLNTKNLCFFRGREKERERQEYIEFQKRNIVRFSGSNLSQELTESVFKNLVPEESSSGIRKVFQFDSKLKISFRLKRKWEWNGESVFPNREGRQQKTDAVHDWPLGHRSQSVVAASIEHTTATRPFGCWIGLFYVLHAFNFNARARPKGSRQWAQHWTRNRLRGRNSQTQNKTILET